MFICCWGGQGKMENLHLELKFTDEGLHEKKEETMSKRLRGHRMHLI